jgi:uncharacterized membrane protein YhaH (DUF805 family)
MTDPWAEWTIIPTPHITLPLLLVMYVLGWVVFLIAACNRPEEDRSLEGWFALLMFAGIFVVGPAMALYLTLWHMVVVTPGWR